MFRATDTLMSSSRVEYKTRVYKKVPYVEGLQRKGK